MRIITTKELRTLHIATRHHHTIKSRLAILRYAEEYGFKGAARRFGLDCKTVRTWHRRWAASGPAGLVPRHPLQRRRRLSEETVRLIEQARRALDFGAMRTRIWLDRMDRIRVVTATIRRICRDLGYPPIRRTGPRHTRQPILFNKEHPGDCVQVDVKEVKVTGQNCVQYTALDDCTRYRVLRLYPRKYHGASLDFLATVRQAQPFPIRKVQADNGTEFPLTFALAVPEAGIRLQYITPRRPEQNGKVERSHRIDEEEFWSRSTFDGFTSPAQALHAWEHQYNHDRFSMALSGPTPAKKLATFTAASSPLPSGTTSSNPLPTPTFGYGSTADRRSCANCARRLFSPPRPKLGDHCLTRYFTHAQTGMRDGEHSGQLATRSRGSTVLLTSSPKKRRRLKTRVERRLRWSRAKGAEP